MRVTCSIVCKDTKSSLFANRNRLYSGEISRPSHGLNRNRLYSYENKVTSDIDLTVAIWALLHDWEGGGVFETMGLIDINGRKKPAWEVWKTIYESPYSR